MKCYVHSERDAVGTCLSCGKAVCQECQVSLQGKLHCKDCLEAGRAATGRPTKSKGFVSSPEGDINPTGPPTKIFFQIGAMGGILGTIGVPLTLLFLIGQILQGIPYGYALEQNLVGILSTGYVPLQIFAEIEPLMLIIAIPTLIVAVSVIMQSIGFFGFYRNYGNALNLVSTIIGIITGVALLAGVAVLLTNTFSLFFTVLLTVVGLVLLSGVFWAISFITMREQTGVSTLAMITGIFFLLGGVLSIISSLLAAIVFYQAYVPEDTYSQGF